MHELRELVTILDRHKSDQLKGWLLNNKTSLQGQLYKLLLNNTVKNNQEASDILYQKKGDTSGIRKLKSDLRDNLEGFALFMTIKAKVKNDVSYEKAILNKEFAAFQNLIIAGGNLCVVDKGERLLTKAIELGATTSAKTVAKTLIQSSVIKHNKEKYLKYTQILNEQSQILMLEEKGTAMFVTVQQWAGNNKASLKRHVPKAEKMLSDFRSERGELSSPNLEYLDIMLELCVYACAHNTNKVFELAQKGVKYFNSLPYFHRDRILTFHQYIIIEHGFRKEYEKALHYGSLNLSWLDEGTHTWFKTLELLAYAALRCGQYEPVLGHHQMAVTNTFYAHNTTPIGRDIFEIYLSQVQLMHEFGAYTPSAKYANQFKNKYRLSSFKNNLEISETDKDGMNVGLLVNELMFLIVRGQFDDLSDRMEAVKKYLQRHVETEGDARIYSFVKLLETGITHNWSLKKMQADPTYVPAMHHLNTTAADLLNMRFEIEIIPYEILWEHVMLCLVRN
jgi:hypothetical protein